MTFTGSGATKSQQDRIDLANTADAHEEKKMDMKSKLSTLWAFVSLNYLYCDVSSLMDPELLPQYLRGKRSRPAIQPHVPPFRGHTRRDFHRDGSPVQGAAVQGESLGKHCGRYRHDHDTTGNTVRRRASTLLFLLQRYRDSDYCIHRLVCVELDCGCRGPVHDSARARQIATTEALLLVGFQNADIVADQRFSGCRLTQRAPTGDAVKDLRPRWRGRPPGRS